MLTVQEINGYSKKFALAYERALLPLAKETNMPHTAISILLFIANNPDFATAGDICELRGLKRPIVSTHVERLVREGYIERRAFPTDRRKDALICTEKAADIIEAGRKRQLVFAETLLEGISDHDLAVMERCIHQMNCNMNRIIKEKSWSES